MARRALDPAHEAEFKRRYGSQKDSELAQRFDITESAVRAAAKHFALSKDKAWAKRNGIRTTMPRWSDEELLTLHRLYPDTSNEEIARQLGRSVKSVASKAHQLRLKKTQDRLVEMGRRNVRRRYQ